ncbi:MAG: hypothetical protein WCX31_08590 [Salinivirgaceae bacterium]
MKTRNAIFGMLALSAAMFFTACEKETVLPKDQETTILPERFKIDIPSSLSNSTHKSGSLKSAKADTISGNEIYENLQMFIAIGEGTSDIVESIIFHIKLYHIQDIGELTFTGDDDSRVKHLVVESGVDFDNRTWEYMLTITDLESEGNADGGIGMQVFWNNSPIEGVAIIKPSNLNHNDTEKLGEAMYSVEYSEKGLGDYEAYMIVQISNLPMASTIIDRYAVNAIKMFVGKKGDIIDVYGNSNHPNAQFFTDKTGFNWAFVASGQQTADIAVAEVALPPSTLDETSRTIILKDYSLKSVFTSEINTWFLETYGVRPDSSDLAGYLRNADAPGFFANGSFIQGGTAPNNNYGELLIRIEGLTPYNPISISELSLVFKQ